MEVARLMKRKGAPILESKEFLELFSQRSDPVVSDFVTFWPTERTRDGGDIIIELSPTASRATLVILKRLLVRVHGREQSQDIHLFPRCDGFSLDFVARRVIARVQFSGLAAEIENREGLGRESLILPGRRLIKYISLRAWPRMV